MQIITKTKTLKQTPDYEMMLELIYKHYLKPGYIVIDIGAHIGRHTIPLADAVLPSGKVFCFEPLPAQYQILLDRIHNYSVAHSPDSVGIFPFNCALGDMDGKVNFILAENHPELSGLKKRDYHFEDVVTKDIEVQIYKLDTIKEKFGKVDYIKVDAEGGELSILRGGSVLISESRPIISFELGDSSLVNYEYTSDDYYSFFEDLNYKVYSIFGIHMTRDEFLKATKEQFLWDYIAIPAEASFKFGHVHIKVLLQQLAASAVNPAVQTMSQDASIAAQKIREKKASLRRRFRRSIISSIKSILLEKAIREKPNSTLE